MNNPRKQQLSRQREPADGQAATSSDSVVRLHDVKRAAPASLPQVPAAILGELTGRNELGEFLVTYDGCPAPGLPARTTAPLNLEDIGREVTLVFLNGDPTKPVIAGLLSPAPPGVGGGTLKRRVSVSIDGERLVLSAQREIVLQCGKSSLTLRRDGKVVLRGADLLSRSSGGNRIKGSTVALN